MIGRQNSRAFQALSLVLLLDCLVGLARGHGRLLQPPSRVSLFRNPKFSAINQRLKLEDYNDMGKNCGGLWTQWSRNGGKCGICGDAWHIRPRPQEAPYGHYAQGIIVEQYKTGETIEVTVQLTANHKGWFQFRLCPDPTIEATQDCLDKHVLQLADGSGTKYIVAPTSFQNVSLRLPLGLTCDRCVLQWKYHAGNNWGVDPVTGRGCLGCHPEQEEFYACADVRITSGSNTDIRDNGAVAARTTTTIPPKCQGAGNLKDSPEVAKRCTEACASGCCPAQLCSDSCRSNAP